MNNNTSNSIEQEIEDRVKCLEERIDVWVTHQLTILEVD